MKHQRLNHSVALHPGEYHVEVNGSIHTVSLSPGYLMESSTSTLIITEKIRDGYNVIDSAGRQLVSNVHREARGNCPEDKVIAGQLTSLEV